MYQDYLKQHTKPAKILTLDDRIMAEYFQQGHEISDTREELWTGAPKHLHAVISRAFLGMKELQDETRKPGRDLIAFYEQRYGLSRPLINWGSIADYSPLVWKQHGCGSQLPDWYPDALWKAELAALLAQPADVRYSVMHESGTTFLYRIWDAANPFYAPWVQRVQMKSADPARAEAYVKREYTNHKRLHEGAVLALIHYRETGQAVMPAWIPDNGLRITNRDGALIGRYPRLDPIQEQVRNSDYDYTKDHNVYPRDTQEVSDFGHYTLTYFMIEKRGQSVAVYKLNQGQWEALRFLPNANTAHAWIVNNYTRPVIVVTLDAGDYDYDHTADHNLYQRDTQEVTVLWNFYEEFYNLYTADELRAQLAQNKIDDEVQATVSIKSADFPDLVIPARLGPA